VACWRIFLMVIAGVFGTAGCVRPTSFDLTPRQILARAADEADKLDTAHFSLEQQNGSLRLVSGIRISNADGDVRRPDGLQMRYTLLLGGGLSAEEHLIAVGDEQFVTNPFTGLWQPQVAAKAAPRFLDKVRGVSNLLRTLDNPQRLSDEVLEAVPTLHITGSLRTGAFADMTDSETTTDVVHTEVWVGAEDFLIRKLWLEGPLDMTDTPSTVRILTFSHFNRSVDIRAPSV
jgi:hypothetical protein